ncbi:MAG: DNA-3-methyladenine glycosylase 2 family protein [Hyphomicrobiaceae bacterium]|nr:DNA-3-methyladenine glycosylase 2 family protein [Hyphomicrobiaceae bacterium]
MAKLRNSSGRAVAGRGSTIETEDDIRAGMRALRRQCSALRRVHDVTGDPPLRRRPAGLEGLARIVVGQQLSIASAAAIWSRLEVAVAPLGAGTLLAASDEVLRRAGLSTPKIRTLRNIASAAAAGELVVESLGSLRDEAVHEQLTCIPGIGPWTADIFIMFCLGRRDAFAAGDLALQVAADGALGLGYRPGAAELTELAERWRPWRGVAARLLWAYYPILKQRRSGAPL